MVDHLEISYRSDISRCRLNVFSNTESLHQPVAVVLHGGAWALNDKSAATEMCVFLRQAGYTCVAPSYQLSNISDENIQSLVFFETLLLIILIILAEGKIKIVIALVFIFLTLLIVSFTLTADRENIQHPTHVEDIAHVLRWTYHNIRDFNGDPERIYIIGHSAGGHLATLIATNGLYLRQVGLEPTIIKGVVSLSGVFSDAEMKRARVGNEILKTIFGNRAEYFDAFPIYNIRPDTCPHLLLNAGVDYTLKRHTFDYYFALREKGVYVKAKIYDHTNHFNIRRFWGGAHAEVYQDIVVFLDSI